MIRNIIVLITALSLYSSAFANINRTEFCRNIMNDPNKKNDIWWLRALKTVNCEDCDYIPKIEGAGEIYFEDGNEYQLMHNGIKILKGCYYDYISNGWMSEIIRYLKGHHEPQEEKAFYEVLKYIPDDAVMIELGSYWAYYSMWFKKEKNKSQVFLIEPNEQNLNIGKHNFSINNLKGNFYWGYVGCKSEPIITDKVPFYTIDNFLEKNNIKTLDLLHSDIQGAELSMLQGAKKSLADKKIKFIFISTHSESLHSRCISLLKNHGYSIVVEHNLKQSCSGDGLIVAKSKDAFGPKHVAVSKY